MTAKQGGSSGLRWFFETFGVGAASGALFGALVSALLTWWTSSIIEDRKSVVAEILTAEQEFDHSESGIFAKIAVFNNDVMDKGKVNAQQRDSLLSSIVEAQSTLLVLRQRLHDEKAAHSIDDYNKELGDLAANLHNVAKPNDLGPIFASVQRLLELHDQVAEAVDSKAKIARVF